MYMNLRMSPIDWYTPEYGLVLRMQPALLVDWTLQEANSEWKSLKKTNFLLGELIDIVHSALIPTGKGHRFGDRKRPYLTHLPKAFSVPMLSEVKQVWAEDIQETREQKFPNIFGHKGSFNNQFAMSHYTVERWREGLLFSWIVGKIGGDHDEWDLAVALKELNAIDPEASGDTELIVTGFQRDTMINDRINKIFDGHGYEPLEGQTSYAFSEFIAHRLSSVI